MDRSCKRRLLPVLPCLPRLFAAPLRHCYESMARTPIRDSLAPPISTFQRKLESRRGGEGKDHRTMGRNDSPPHFHPLVCRLERA